MFRWLVYGLPALLLGLVTFTAVAGWLLLARFDIGPIAARFASRVSGRTVTISGLHVTPGRWLAVDLGRLTLANVAGGSRPSMIEIRHLRAEISAMSLLRRPVTIRRLDIDGLSLLLERTADRTPNWRFGSGPKRSAPSGGGRNIPTLLDARLTNSEILYRTSSSPGLRVGVDHALLQTEAADRPVRVTITGAYNRIPLELKADLQSISTLRDSGLPYGMLLRLASGGAVLNFSGSATDPLDMDGMRGRLELDAASFRSISTLFGGAGSLDAPIRLTGDFRRDDDHWQLNQGSGTLADVVFSAPSIRLVEGASGRPDAVTIQLATTNRLDLDKLLGQPAGPAAQGHGPGVVPAAPRSDIILDILRHPDPLVNCSLSAAALIYRGLTATGVSAGVTVLPGHVGLQALALTYLGARIRADGQIDDADPGVSLSAHVEVSDADAQQVRQLLGLAKLPLFGNLAARLTVHSSGLTLDQAGRTAEVAATISMNGGRIDRQVIEMASTDLRALWRKAPGTTAVTCLLGVVTLHAGVGTVAPLRIRTDVGTIVGHAVFDLSRDTFDLTFGTKSRSTGLFALDIPIRVSGSFASPIVRPASWTASGRAAFAAADAAGSRQECR